MHDDVFFLFFGQTFPPSTPAFFAPLRSAKKSSVQVGLQEVLENEILLTIERD